MGESRKTVSTVLKVNRLMHIMPDLACLEENLHEKGYHLIAGVDEAGRGPLAGPVLAAAVILPAGIFIEGLDDSKKLTPQRRDELFEEIAASNALCSVGIIDSDTIDKVNILQASLLAMRKAVCSLKTKAEFILVDGPYTIPNIEVPQMAIIGGDRLSESISAASIIAKVTRDRIMNKYEELFPEFSFSCHKGYATPNHLAELKEYGPTDIHRKSFRPVEEILKQINIDF